MPNLYFWSFLGGYWWGRYRKCMWPGPGQWRNFPRTNKKLHQSEFCLHFHFHCFHVHHFHFPHFHIHTLRHDWIYIANKRGAKRAISQYQVCLDSNNCNFTKVTDFVVSSFFFPTLKLHKIDVSIIQFAKKLRLQDIGVILKYISKSSLQVTADFDK